MLSCTDVCHRDRLAFHCSCINNVWLIRALQQPLCEALVSSEPVIVVTHHDNHTLGSLGSTYQTLGYDAEPYGTLQMHYSFGQYKPVWANISSVQMSPLLAWSSYRS